MKKFLIWTFLIGLTMLIVSPVLAAEKVVVGELTNLVGYEKGDTFYALKLTEYPTYEQLQALALGSYVDDGQEFPARMITFKAEYDKEKHAELKESLNQFRFHGSRDSLPDCAAAVDKICQKLGSEGKSAGLDKDGDCAGHCKNGAEVIFVYADK